MSIRIRILIATVDRTTILLEDGWMIHKYYGASINDAMFTLNDINNNISISEGAEVIIEDFDDATVRYFGGIITEVEYVTAALSRHIIIHCSGWKYILDKTTVNAEFVNATDKAIIQSSFTTAGITEIDTNTLTIASRTIPNIKFNGNTLRDVMDAICEITGFEWDVNQFKKLVYQPNLAYAPVAPFFEFSDQI